MQEIGDLSNGSSAASKRNRISFVCQACRKSKTKCDREKPSCTRCLKHGIKCVYDVERQTPPKNPSKDAMIARLRREVEYWQARAIKNQQNATDDKTSVSRESSDKSSGDDSYHDNEPYQKPVPRPEDIMVNFYRFFPNIIMTDCSSRDIKPSSDIAQVMQDKFLSVFFASVFAASKGNALINSISTEKRYSYSKQSNFHQDLLNLRDRMLKNCSNDVQRARVNHFIDRIMQGSDSPKEVRTGFFLNLVTTLMHKTFVENTAHEEGVYSSMLADLISQAESTLPSLTVIEQYKRYFYKCVYPFIPYLDMCTFEKTLGEIIVVNSANPQKVKLVLGKKDLRMKIETLAILLVILSISYNAMKSELSACNFITSSANDMIQNSTLIKEFPINESFVLLSQRAIASLNFFVWTTENSLCCLMYMWAFFAFSPDEGDFYYGQPTEFIMGCITTLATNIGLHRDPTHYKQFKEGTIIDQRRVNYRRKLWLCIATMNSVESILKGRYTQAMNDYMNSFLSENSRNSNSYMNLVISDSVDKEPLNLRIHSWIFQRYETFALLLEFDKVWLNLNSETSLDYIEELMMKVRDRVDKNFSIEDMNKTEGDEVITIPHLRGLAETLNIGGIQKVSKFQTYLIARLILLRVLFSLFLYFEIKCNDSEYNYFPYYIKYLMEMIQEFLRVTKIYEKFYNGELSNSSQSFTTFATDKSMQMCIGTILYTVVALILRFTHAIHLLQQVQKNEQFFYGGRHDNLKTTESSKKLEVLNSLRRDFESLLEKICQLSSRHLRITFFSVFKMLLCFDYILQIIKKDELMNKMARLSNLEVCDEGKTNLFLAFGFDISKIGELMQGLNDANHLTLVDVDSLIQIQNCMHDMDFSEAQMSDIMREMPKQNMEATFGNETYGRYNKSQQTVPNALSTDHQSSNDIISGNPGETVANSNSTTSVFPLSSALDLESFDYFDLDFLFRDG
ncbi:LAFE_0D12486g1_1 [Lachancea fermentati]|uniref:LAFE_0D12486g1_1 n=1 Tax=Lachancea fermentati TaxID=4955 RepID=A0A1G4MCF8_LACFM|nr:LAFE_0D12486g1_1 [Lachancea fermentati]